MKLKIRNVGPKDFGSYKCVAQNSLGGTDGVIKLDGKCVIKVISSFFYDIPQKQEYQRDQWRLDFVYHSGSECFKYFDYMY